MANYNVKLKDKDGNYLYPYTLASQVEGINDINVKSASKLQNGKAIDGISFDGTTNLSRYTTCSTASGTKDKIASISGLKLIVGTSVLIKFTNTNTAVNPTLNINSLGAYPILHKGANIKADLLEANIPFMFIFTGNAWEISNGVQQETSILTVTYW